MAEKRFDVRVPEENTAVLEMLATLSKKTGVSEARLIVVLLSLHAEGTGGKLLPPAPQREVMMPVGGISSNGHQEGMQPPGVQPLLNNDMLNSFLEED